MKISKEGGMKSDKKGMIGMKGETRGRKIKDERREERRN